MADNNIFNWHTGAPEDPPKGEKPRYLVTLFDGEVHTATRIKTASGTYWDIDDTYDQFYDSDGRYSDKDVVAWTELPKPYIKSNYMRLKEILEQEFGCDDPSGILQQSIEAELHECAGFSCSQPFCDGCSRENFWNRPYQPKKEE